MVDEEKYCIDVPTRISSAVSVLEKVGPLILHDHVEHCVRESMARGGGDAEAKVGGPASAVKRFLRV